MAEDGIPVNRLGAGGARALGNARVVRVVRPARVVGSARVGSARTAGVSIGATGSEETVEHFVRWVGLVCLGRTWLLRGFGGW